MKGQTLIELLIGLTITIVIISAITIVAISSLGNTRSSNNQTQATRHAGEGMEIIRMIRNTNYAGFRSYNGTYCLTEGQTTLGARVSSCTVVNIDNTFIRSALIQPNACGVNLSRATVTVSWTDKTCQSGAFCHASRLVSCFSTVSPFL